ncbi:MAG TPA: DNA-binding protein, partial [Verrucomicrobiae bacterium]|nr:DNA-binding protein [Verrucomicrobiae bacterium]
VLRATPQSQALVHELISSGILPTKAAGDAAHIALSAVHNIHFLLTWNCRHLANAEILWKVERLCETKGFSHPMVCTPRELMGTFEL